MGQVHDLLDARGRQGARDLIEGRRGPRIVEAAAGWASDEDIGTGYMYSGWCQTALPHRRPSDNAAIWKLETDSMTLLVESGVRVAPGGDPVHVGVPFGAIARLILIYLQSEALRTGSRDVELGGSLRAFLGRLEISVGGKTTSLVREQAERISRCRLTFHAARRGGSVLVNQNIVDMAMFVDRRRSRRPGKPVRGDRPAQRGLLPAAQAARGTAGRSRHPTYPQLLNGIGRVLLAGLPAPFSIR